MKKIKTSFSACLILSLALSCSKSDDPAASVCSFTFKGTSYSPTNAVCNAIGGGQSLGASISSTSALILTKGGLVGDGINFTNDSKTGDYSSDNSGTPPTITISGKEWTFKGNLADDFGATGTISGKCTCSN